MADVKCKMSNVGHSVKIFTRFGIEQNNLKMPAKHRVTFCNIISHNT